MTNKDAKRIALRWLLPWRKWGAIDDAEADGHAARINGHGSQCVPRAWRWFPSLRAAWLRGWDDEDAAMLDAEHEAQRIASRQEPDDE